MRKMFEERKWGRYTVTDVKEGLEFGITALTKYLEIDEGKNLSYQYHSGRSEVWVIIEGNGLFANGSEITSASVGDIFYIPERSWHSMRAVGGTLKFYEVQYGEVIDEEDIVRSHYEWQDIIDEIAKNNIN